MKSSIYIWIILIFSAIPFFSYVDLYPFTRYAMFAEPVNNEHSYEYFELVNEANKPIDLEKRGFPLPPSYCNYLARTYYYKNEIMTFLKTIKKGINTDGIKAIKLKRTSGNTSNLKSEIVGNLSL